MELGWKCAGSKIARRTVARLRMKQKFKTYSCGVFKPPSEFNLSVSGLREATVGVDLCID